MTELQDDEVVITVHNASGEIIDKRTVSKEIADRLFKFIQETEGNILLAIPLLAKETGVPERTLRGAFDRDEIPYEYVGKKVRASTVDAVNEWKENPEYHKRGRRKVGKKSD